MTLVINSYVVYAPLLKTKKKKNNSKNMNLRLVFLRSWRPFGIAFVTVFHQILNFFFIKIECSLYFLDRFDVLMSKMIFKK